MKIRSLLYLTLVFISLTSADCFKKKDSETGPVHETKITVNLTGEYKADEAADVSIDGGGITVVDFTTPAYSTVEPGTHTIFATAHVLKGTWSHTTEVKEGESKTINIPCDKATLIVKPDILWAGTVNQFLVDIETSDGTFTFTAQPGLDASYSFRPRKGTIITVYRNNRPYQHTTLTRDFFYQDKFTLTIPF
jgi:hypothetical protein